MAQREKYAGLFTEQLKKLNVIPAGRVLFGAGSGTQVTYFNCFVMPFVEDSRGGIAEHEIVTETTDEPRWNSTSDPAEQLKKLKSLYDDGILSSAEYEMKKKEILSKKW